MCQSPRLEPGSVLPLQINMSPAKVVCILLSCKAVQICLAAVTGEDQGDCASQPREVTTGEHVMLQHSHTHLGVDAPLQEGAPNFVAEASPRAVGLGDGAGSPCSCEASSFFWKASTRTSARCVFIDLGAADGNTFNVFLSGEYQDLANCTVNGADAWDAYLVEANPKFDKSLMAEATKYPNGKVKSMHSTAAYMCEAKTSFYLDTVNDEHNNWGSSMSENHVDVVASGKVQVTVPTMNINRLLYEQTIPADRVILKMDIEGAEWDILPCLAKSSSASLIDILLVEVHRKKLSNIGTTAEEFAAAKATLIRKNVLMPKYFSHTL
mmetsp:Transcript_21228/g.39002  ORF Transcript_21228/g.39002 Transcript_21228/m.39002 type:complete len:324 (-) Transcript_21228:216-1187(-)